MANQATAAPATTTPDPATTTRKERPAEIPKKMHFLHLTGYLAPFILLLLGYAFPVMHYRIIDTPSIPSTEAWSLPWILVGELILAFAWLIIDFIIISSNRSSGSQVLRNMSISSNISTALTLLAGGMLFTNNFQWWMLIPFVAAYIDDQIVTNRGGVNLWQKPYAPSPGTRN